LAAQLEKPLAGATEMVTLSLLAGTAPPDQFDPVFQSPPGPLVQPMLAMLASTLRVCRARERRNESACMQCGSSIAQPFSMDSKGRRLRFARQAVRCVFHKISYCGAQ
jgi:hypothetical protein